MNARREARKLTKENSKTVTEEQKQKLISHNIGYHRVRIGRCGAFVGLFRPLENGNWTLWRTIGESDPYGKYQWTVPWFSGEDPFNELHRLPKALNVMDADEMKCVANLLGGSKYTVQRRIHEFAKERSA